MYGYIALLISGFCLLCIPGIAMASISSLDHLFIATSALSTTGLATIDIDSSYSIIGKIIILLLIQVGGLGYMSIGSFIVMVRKQKLSARSADLLRSDFSLPDGFSIVHFLRSLIIFTLGIEFLGAFFLSWIFWLHGESNPIWQGIFHSISAFCTAGFSLLNNSFVAYQNDFYLNFVVSVLSISGALGFIVFTDIFDRFSGKDKQLTFTSKIILKFTFSGILLGTAILFLSDDHIANQAPDARLIQAFFQSMTAFTTVGFNTYDIGAMGYAPLFFLTLLMVIGASPSGTGGGMKSTTFTALYAQLKSTLKGQSEVTYMNRVIPNHRLSMAVSNFFFYIMVICIGTYLLLLVEKGDIFPIFFEAVSALGTVGLSTGITGDLSHMGKIFIVILMFLGRIGPLSFGLALFDSEKEEPLKEEDIAI